MEKSYGSPAAGNIENVDLNNFEKNNEDDDDETIDFLIGNEENMVDESDDDLEITFEIRKSAHIGWGIYN